MIKVGIWNVSEPVANALFWTCVWAFVLGSVLVMLASIGIALTSVAQERIFRERISANEAATAEANRKAAEANRAAEHERLERLKLEQELEKRTAPRRITGDLQTALVAALSPFATSSDPHRPIDAGIGPTTSAFESANFAEQIAQTLELAGWRVNRSSDFAPGFAYSLPGIGVMAGTNPRQMAKAEALVQTLLEQDVLATMLAPSPLLLEMPSITVYVGDHP